MNPAHLFAVPEPPTRERWAAVADGTVGLAEWSDRVPDLFLLLMGAAPAEGLWPVYEEGVDTPALLAPHAEATARLQALLALARGAAGAPWGEGAVAALEVAARVLSDQARPFLLLHHACTLPKAIRFKYQGKPFRAAAAALRDRAATLARALEAATAAGGLGEAPELRRLLERHERETGWWSPAVGEGYWQELSHRPDPTPGFLAPFEGDWYRDEGPGLDYDGRLEAYLVRQISPEGPRWGAVTPYGRWLVPFGPARLDTNRSDRSAGRSVITTTLQVGPPDDHGLPLVRCGLLDANGLALLPAEWAYLSPIGDQLAVVRAPSTGWGGPYRLIRLADGTLLEPELGEHVFGGRDDGFVSADAFGATREDPRVGLFDLSGRLIAPFEYESISNFNARTKVAAVQRGGKIGLMDREGRVVLPIVYDGLAFKTRDTPHFHRDRTLVFRHELDGQGNQIRRWVGVADAKGRVIVEPVHDCWHLAFSFDSNGEVLICQGDVLRQLRADGTLSEPVGSRKATIEELARGLRRSFGLDRPREEAPEDLAGLAAGVDRAALAEVVRLLCRGDAEAAEAMAALLDGVLDRAAAGGAGPDEATEEDDHAGGDGPEWIPWQPGDSPAAPFARAVVYALRDRGLVMHLDWKAVDEVQHAAAHFTDLEALEGFRWDGASAGEDVPAGLDALAAFLAASGWRLVEWETGGDDHLLCAVAAASAGRFAELVAALALPLAFRDDG